LVLPLCRGRIWSALDPGQQSDLAMSLLQPGQIPGRLGVRWLRLGGGKAAHFPRNRASVTTPSRPSLPLLGQTLDACKGSIASYPG